MRPVFELSEDASDVAEASEPFEIREDAAAEVADQPEPLLQSVSLRDDEAGVGERDESAGRADRELVREHKEAVFDSDHERLAPKVWEQEDRSHPHKASVVCCFKRSPLRQGEPKLYSLVDSVSVGPLLLLAR